MKHTKIKLPKHEWPFERYGAMLVEGQNEDGEWDGYAVSGKAGGNIRWDTEAIDVAIIRPGEIVLSREEFREAFRRRSSANYLWLENELFGEEPE